MSFFFLIFKVTDEGGKIDGSGIATNGEFCFLIHYFLIIPSNNIFIYKWKFPDI